MLIAEGFSETKTFHAFTHLSFSESIISEILKLEAHFLSKCSKFNVDFKNALIKQQNVFVF